MEALLRPNNFNTGWVKFFRARSISTMDEEASEHPGLRMTIAHKQIFDIVSDYAWDRNETNDPHKRLFPVCACKEQKIEGSTRIGGAPGKADL